jgi:hypothetical protein
MRNSLAGAGLALLVCSGALAEDDPPPPRPLAELKLGVEGNVGAGVRLLLVPSPVPVPSVGPAAGLGLSLKVPINERWRIVGGVGGSVGFGEELGGSYRALVGLGYRWVNGRVLTLTTDAMAGLGSESLIPLPEWLLRTDLKVTPVALTHFRWELGLVADAGAYVIAPHVALAPYTSAEIVIGNAFFGAQLAANGDVVVAAVYNRASASAEVTLFVGAWFK